MVRSLVPEGWPAKWPDTDKRGMWRWGGARERTKRRERNRRWGWNKGWKGRRRRLLLFSPTTIERLHLYDVTTILYDIAIVQDAIYGADGCSKIDSLSNFVKRINVIFTIYSRENHKSFKGLAKRYFIAFIYQITDTTNNSLQTNQLKIPIYNEILT